MRISDWSSDVCSSDLLSADALKTLHDALDAQRDINRRLDIANFIRVPVVVRAKIVADPARVADEVQAAASKALLEDRKSVVSGKSVSVRVALGGRRIIKKKIIERSHI